MKKLFACLLVTLVFSISVNAIASSNNNDSHGKQHNEFTYAEAMAQSNSRVSVNEAPSADSKDDLQDKGHNEFTYAEAMANSNNTVSSSETPSAYNNNNVQDKQLSTFTYAEAMALSNNTVTLNRTPYESILCCPNFGTTPGTQRSCVVPQGGGYCQGHQIYSYTTCDACESVFDSHVTHSTTGCGRYYGR